MHIANDEKINLTKDIKECKTKTKQQNNFDLKKQERRLSIVQLHLLKEDKRYLKHLKREYFKA